MGIKRLTHRARTDDVTAGIATKAVCIPPPRASTLVWRQHLPSSPRFQLGILAATIAMTCLGSSPVSADCTPSTPADGGTVTCTGGFIAGGVNSSAANITVNVDSSAQVGSGVSLSGTGQSTVNNDGTIQGAAVTLTNPTADSSKTLTNNGTLNNGIVGSGDGTITINQNGTLNSGGITITGNGTNTLILSSGHSTNGTVSLTGAVNRVESSGNFNSGLQLNGTVSNTFINRGGQVSGVDTYVGPSNFIRNDGGTFNNGISFASDGQNLVENFSGGIINGNLVSTGLSNDVIDNNGTINSSVSLGAGNDFLFNRPLGTTISQSVQGTIDFGTGNDVFNMLGGTVNGNILMGEGNDSIIIAGGTISTDMNAGSGNDVLLWTNGQIIHFTMGDNTDRAVFLNLSPTQLATGLRFEGGQGSDELEWNNTVGDGVDRYIAWELFNLTKGSQLTFSNFSTLTLGDSGTGTGQLVIDATSSVLAGNGTHTVSPAVSGQLVTVTNAGLINLTNSNPTATDRFVVLGNYVGQGGQLNIQTVLASDDSPSDQLVIRGAGASGSGSTTLNVTNLNGPGDMTVLDGIRVVDADGGATTTPGAFQLGGPVAAGLFEYQLFRGGKAAGNEEDWFLRTEAPSPPTVSPPPPPPVSPPPPPPVSPPPPPPVSPPPPPPVSPPPPPISPPVSPPVSPPGSVSPPPVPLVRPEVPGYTLAPVIARQMDREVLGTFHKRQGDQFLLTGDGTLPATWARVYGEKYEQEARQKISRLDFDIAPEFDGHIWGFQVGQDLYAVTNDDGSKDRVGLMFSQTEAEGDVEGYTLARRNNQSGKLDLDSYSLGLYGTHLGDNGWYLDAVLMNSWIDGEAKSDRGIKGDIEGTTFLASLEAGYPIELNSSWTLEPQAQVIWQKSSLDDTHDRFSEIGYENASTYTGRVGVRAENMTRLQTTVLQPYLDLNLWHDFNTTDSVSFNGREVDMSYRGNVLEVGGGISAQLTPELSVYAAVSSSSNLDKEDSQSTFGNIGLRILW
ncbi:autotransporter outer membrane beta-barrel domain-containing protein [Pseudomonas sp. LS44]|uniref:autotransporter family protein n=1 Tax=Pseudomonas sp. LS44 TaxID=1357074 RepID=UPI00215B1E25|nr:autotransporter outer membrane beta-barrel domain-containing protein [Pseudomonas sp. LS44]UVE17463.1 autotransporter outer membrane beta-barrel domain-containing protein [Pseudomonas sp. LS44]